MQPHIATRLPATGSAEAAGYALPAAVALLLAFTFFTGGGSQDRGPGDVAAQLAALPVIVWSAWALSSQRATWPIRIALAVAVLIAALPALQLLPLPFAVGPARESLRRDLLQAGVASARGTWTLTPKGTELALWSLLPALAVFLGALAVQPRHRRTLLQAVIALAMASLALGLVQLGLPQDSLLNPFPQWSPAFGGVFANPNHQATSLAIALVLALGMWVDAARQADADSRPRSWVYASVVIVSLLTLPLTGSRGGVIIAMLAAVVVLMAKNALPLRRALREPRALAAVIAAALVAVVGILAALQWIQVDATEELRQGLARATVAIGNAHIPWGSGVGSFVQVFEQGAPAEFRLHVTVNHAHNEFAQWWLEGGVAAMLLLAAVLGVLAFSARAALRSAPATRAVVVPSLVAVAAVLVHSMGEYPLRTPALMSTCALLAGLAIAATREKFSDDATR